MDGAGDRATLHASNIALIREVYDSENAHETFEMELERALEANCMVIIIEPTRLGDETAGWIAVGLIWSNTPAVFVPFGAVSTICTGLYTIAWQFDPCVHYQVETDSRRLARIPVLTMVTAASPVVLVHKNDTRRRYLHCGVTITAITFCAWRLYNIFK